MFFCAIFKSNAKYKQLNGSKANIAGWLISIFLSASCAAFQPIASEYDFVKVNAEDIELSELGNGRVLIHNGSNFLHVFSGRTSAFNLD